MDENTVVTTATIPADAIVNSVATIKEEPAKTEPAKTEKPANAEVEKLKAALSRANGEAAEYKRQLREKQTEAERATGVLRLNLSGKRTEDAYFAFFFCVESQFGSFFCA